MAAKVMIKRELSKFQAFHFQIRQYVMCQYVSWISAVFMPILETLGCNKFATYRINNIWNRGFSVGSDRFVGKKQQVCYRQTQSQQPTQLLHCITKNGLHL